jgi:AcrR family transcriptional regulator
MVGWVRMRKTSVTRLSRPRKGAGVNASTVYRRWASRVRLVGEALLERGQPLSPTPDTGALQTDLERLLIERGALLRTPAVVALFEVLLTESGTPSSENCARPRPFLCRPFAGGASHRRSRRGAWRAAGWHVVRGAGGVDHRAGAEAIVSRAEAALRDDHDVLIPRYSKKRK